MGTMETEQAIALMRRHRALAEFVGGASAEQIEAAEARLGVRFPPSYRQFIEEVGAVRFAGHDVLGVVGRHGDPRLDVVRVTLDERAHTDMSDEHIVVGPYGREAVFALDCADRRHDGECPVAEFPRDYGEIQEPNFFDEDFGDFVLRWVRDELGEHAQLP